MSEYVWQIKDKKLSIMQLASSTVTTPSSAIGTLRMHCKYFPAPFTVDLTETLEFPSQFEMAPVAYVMQLLAAREKDYSSIKFWKGMWDDLVRDGKRYLNKGQDGTVFEIVVHEHFGD